MAFFMPDLPEFQNPAPDQPTGVVPAAPKQNGILAFLADPKVRAMLMGASQGFGQAAMNPGMGRTGALAQGLTGAATGLGSWEEQQAKAAAQRVNAMLEQRKLDSQIARDAAAAEKDLSEAAKNKRGATREVNLGDRVAILDENGKEISSYKRGADPAEIMRIQAAAEAAARADKQAAFGNATGLRKEVTTQLAPYKASMDYADRLTATLDNYQPGISSNAAVKLYNLMIEPTSVVRGEDFDAAVGTGGAFRQFAANVKSLSEGMELPANVRKELRRYADIYKNLASSKAQGIASGYIRTAETGGIDPALLQIDSFLSTPGGASSANQNNPGAW